MSARLSRWHFRLYLADDRQSVAAEETLQRICEKHLAGSFAIEVLHVDRRGVLSGEHRGRLVPSCVRLSPGPIKTVVDLSSFEQLLV
jgi:hypothetical protein